jgi:hypothetical protein
VKEDKTKALDMFDEGEGGFKDRDIYVFCANASDGIVTAHPYGRKGEQLRDVFGKKGYPLGQEIMQKATRRDDKRSYLPVAAPWLRQACREDDLLHEGGRSNLRCRLL